MRLVFISEMYAPSIGGLESRIRSFAIELAAQGHDVEVWCIGHAPGLAAVERLDDVTVRRIVVDPRYMTGGLGRRNWTTVAHFCWKLWRSSTALSEFDAIVFGKWPILHALLVPLPHKPVAAFDWCEIRSGPVWALLYRMIAARKRLRHVTIHGGIARWLVDRGVPVQKVSTVGSSGPPTELVRLEEKRNLHILFMGRLSEHKQPMLLLRAFAAGHLGEQGYTLNIAGAGPQSDELAAAAQGVPGVRLLGRISETTKRELLRQCTLLALPSLREGFPVVVAEACSFGTPTLTIESPDNGTAYVVPQLDCGWVVPGTLESLTQGLRDHANYQTPEWQRCHRNALARSADTLSIRAQSLVLLAALGSTNKAASA